MPDSGPPHHDKAVQRRGRELGLGGPLLCFNADCFKARVLSRVDASTPPRRCFVPNAGAISQPDSTGAQALDDLIGELQGRGMRLVIARPKLYMRKYGRPMGVGEKICSDNIVLSVRAAVGTILSREAQSIAAEPNH